MFLIRDATEADLPDLRRLAHSFNTVNLPDDEGELRQIVDMAERSFAGRIRKPFEREYTFVMEDTETEAVIGTSQIIAQHGTREAPHIYLDVLEEEHYSETIDRHFRHKVLRIGFDYEGPSEIGGLVLDSSYRGRPGKLGKQLSFVRFTFMAMHRERFRDVVLAELLPPLGEGGRSSLWEALGRRFTGMDYREADLVSKHNKEFIKNLFPTGVIYASLFDDEARDVIGKVGGAWPVVEAMLDRGTALLCAQMVGAARKDIEMAIEYAKFRQAFGQPIGAFQSVGHTCADMQIWVDGGELLTFEALWKLDQGQPAWVEVSQAKSFCNEKLEAAVRNSQSIHGGIGFMMEFDLQLWFRRVSAWSMRMGTTYEHRARIARALIDMPGDVILGRPVPVVPEAA
jgi:arginine N-succinyltransferase